MLLTAVTATLFTLFPAQQTDVLDDRMNAPAPFEVDGLTGVGIDINTLEAKVVFDLETKTASVVADLKFRMTGDGGMPIFDLRQEITSAKLNGKKIDPEKMAPHKFGKTAGTMRIIEKKLDAKSEHHLHLEYSLAKPQSPSAIEIGWGEGTLDWDFYFSDLNHGRYMEMWFPANLIYDRFGFEFDLEIKGLKEEHEIVTNGTIAELGKTHWQLSFPEHYTAFSHMLVIVPSKDVERTTASATLPGNKKVEVDVCRRKNTSVTNEGVHELVVEHMTDFTESTGEWPHGDRCTVFVWTGGRSMEYDGATTTSMGALSHELHHSWYGRGVKPRSQNDGWYDEAWTVFAADGFRGNEKVVTAEARKSTLCPTHLPWNRITPNKSYSTGALAFGRIAHAIGEEKLMNLMSLFFDKYKLRTASTQEMEAFLFAATKDPAVKQIFHRYIYGRDGSWTDAADSKKD